MKLVLFGKDRRLGAIQGHDVIDLGLAISATVSGARERESVAIVSSLTGLILAGERGLDIVRTAIDGSRGLDLPGLRSNLQSSRLHAPFPEQRFIFAGANFADHIANYLNNWIGVKATEDEQKVKARAGDPSCFWAGVRPIMGPDAKIQIPDRANGYFDYEGEPAIILAREGKDIKATQAESFIWGLTLAIDWTIRDISKPPKPNNPFMERKNFDFSKSIGPCILVGESFDFSKMNITTTVNGEIRQNFNVGNMIFPFGELIEFLSRDLTLFPGDVISGGTGGGTAMDLTKANSDGTYPLDLFLKAGDAVEVYSPEIGFIRSEIVPKAR
jgi:2-keto-4-pentenoate hydratase/2-oxohepta-3-ene-1,7-dioic acid hydratase in catechol pathway